MNTQVVSGLSMALPIALVLLLGFVLLFRKRPAERLLALRSMVLMFLLFMIVQFLFLVLHEGGHSLYTVWQGVPVTLYVHPFFFIADAFCNLRKGYGGLSPCFGVL